MPRGWLQLSVALRLLPLLPPSVLCGHCHCFPHTISSEASADTPLSTLQLGHTFLLPSLPIHLHSSIPQARTFFVASWTFALLCDLPPPCTLTLGRSCLCR